MQSLQEFAANKSCPELSTDTDIDYLSLSQSHASSDLLNHALSFPLLKQLSGSLGRESDHDPELGNMTTVEEDAIEILSCHAENPEEPPRKMKTKSAPVAVKLLATLEEHDPTQVNRKRVVRAVGVVTFLLLLFSVVLIGVSLNMSKSIDEMAGAKSATPPLTPPSRGETQPYHSTTRSTVVRDAVTMETGGLIRDAVQKGPR